MTGEPNNKSDGKSDDEKKKNLDRETGVQEQDLPEWRQDSIWSKREEIYGRSIVSSRDRTICIETPDDLLVFGENSVDCSKLGLYGLAIC